MDRLREPVSKLQIPRALGNASWCGHVYQSTGVRFLTLVEIIRRFTLLFFLRGSVGRRWFSGTRGHGVCTNLLDGPLIRINANFLPVRFDDNDAWRSLVKRNVHSVE